MISIQSGYTNYRRENLSGIDWFKTNYESLYTHLIETEKLIQSSPKKRGKGVFNRDDQGEYWWELRPCNYWEDFSEQKIVYPNMTKFLPFVLDSEGFYTNQKCFIITGTNLKYLTAFLNSKLFKFCFSDNFPELQGGTRELSKIFFEKIRVALPEPVFLETVNSMVDKMNGGPQDDEFEKISTKLDLVLCENFKLTQAEIEVVLDL